MLKKIIELKQTLLNKTPFLYKVFYNIGRFPSEAIATFHNEIVTVNIQNGYTEAEIKLMPTGETQTVLCSKYILLTNQNDVKATIDRMGYNMLMEYERKVFEAREKEFEAMKQYIAKANISMIAVTDILPAIEEMKSKLPSWKDFEIAQWIPLWLLWFYNVGGFKLSLWVQDKQYLQYLSKINAAELNEVRRVWATHIQFLNSQVTQNAANN